MRMVQDQGNDSLAGEIGKRKRFDVPEQETFLNLVRTADELTAEFSRLFKTHGVTDAQYNALRILRGHDRRVPTHHIADQMVTREPDITRLIDRLEKAGYVHRERCPDDRRVVWVCLNPTGRELLAKLDRPVVELHQRQLGHLGPQKLKTLSRLLFEARRPDRADV